MQNTLSETTKSHLIARPRRNRKSPAIRNLIQETHLQPSHFVAPLFILEGTDKKEPINSMPKVFRLSIDHLLREVEDLLKHGIAAIDLFAYNPKERKDFAGTWAYHPENHLYCAIAEVKQHFPEMCIMVDIALDPYTDHGHDGITDGFGNIVNDSTLEALGKMSLLAAQAGADVIAPSDMMDGRVAHIRQVLDDARMTDVSILSYTVKYTSAFYGPFRDALGSAPKFGDKKTYQLNPANSREALREAYLDEIEGADMLMVKPALPYLDIVAKLREATTLPIGAYHVSGEYAMIMAAAEKGWIDADKALLETFMCIRRAGADFILNYASKQVAKIL